MLCDLKTKKTHYLKNLLVTLVVVFSLATMTLGVSASASQTDIDANQVGTVSVKVDGKKTPVALNGRTTVQDVLDTLGIKLGDMDEISIETTDYLENKDEFIIVRRGYSNKVVKGVIPFETVMHYSEDVSPGQEVVLVEGKDGLGTQTIRQFVVDGVVKEETLVSSDYETEPITKEVGMGFASTPISSLNHEWSFDENREPENVINVLRGQRATAYTAYNGARTATGIVAQVGHVAVNPNVIPYGSKLFIQSSDGKFIYGYAIASDTGGALMSGAAAVDLYFDTNNECVQFGVKNLDIFVLETPSK